jgi:predicted nucleic acid-binding protein
MAKAQPHYILDSFALLAYLQGEDSGVRIREILQGARNGKGDVSMSIINLGETLYTTERRKGAREAQDVLASIRQLPINILPADEQTVLDAAHVKANYAISYADSFVVVAAMSEGAIVLTGDPEFESVESLVKVEWLQKSTDKS